MTTPIITNKVSLMGQVSTDFQFSHKRNGICYYMAEIEVERTSGYADHIPVIVSEKILNLPGKDSDICLKGQFRSRNQIIDGKKRLVLSVLASEMNILDRECGNKLPVGCQLQIWGRIQSRTYYKKTENILEERTAYEVSVSRMKYAPCHIPEMEKLLKKPVLCNF